MPLPTSFLKISLLFCVLSGCFYNCASQQLVKKDPFQINEVYVQNWVSGVSGGKSGVNIFVNIKHALPKQLQLDSIYFKNYKVKLNLEDTNGLLYAGRYIHPVNTKDLIQSTYNPASSKTSGDADFNGEILTDNECIIQFKKSGRVFYYKYQHVYIKSTPLIPAMRNN